MEIYNLFTIDKLPDPEWIIDDIIPNNSCIAIYGQPGCGKTFLALDICFNIAYNNMWNSSKITKTGLVFYFLGEGVAGIKKRIKAWHEYNNKQYNEKFHLIPMNKYIFWDKENVNTAIKLIKDIEAKLNQKTVLIVVDTLARASIGLDENSAKDMSIFLNCIENIIASIKCSVMLVHHLGKDVTRGMRGSSSILGAIDTSILITKKDQLIKVTTTKQKDGEPKEIHFNLIKFKNTMVVSRPNNTVCDLLSDIEDEKSEEKSEEKADDIVDNCINNKITEKPDKFFKKWTKDDETKIKSGKSFSSVAKDLSRTLGGVKARFKKILRDNNEKNFDDILKKYNIIDKKAINIVKHYVDKINSLSK